jgi:hypothetical protein
MVMSIKKYLYIAGPMTGYPNFNFDAFMRAEKAASDGTFEEIFNPARKDLETYGEELSKENPTGDPALATASHGFSLRDALGKDLEFITSKATHIYMLKGWEKSSGARAEHATATALGLEIMYQ